MLLGAKKYFYVLLVVCVLLLLVPQILRIKYDSGFTYGEESYNNLRIAKLIHENKALPVDDIKSYGGRPYSEEFGWPLMLSLNVELLAKILPFIFGILSFILFYLILTKVNYKIRGLASLFLIISPSFIYLFSTPNKYGLALLLSLLGLFLYLRNKKWFALVIFISIGFASILVSLLILLCFLLYSLIYKKKLRYFILLFLGILIVFLLQFYRLLVIGIPETFFGVINWDLGLLIGLLFGDFGSMLGLSLFLFVLGLVGARKLADKNYRYYFLFLFLIILIALIPYFRFLIFYLALVIAVFAAYGAIELLEREWRSDVFKKLIILVLCCGLLFSILAYMKEIPNFTPSEKFSEGIKFLESQELNGTIFSHYSRGSYISYAGKKNFMDSNFLYAPGVDTKFLDSDRLIHTENINVALAIINKYNIEYIWLDKQLIDQLWAGDEIELLFILKYSPQAFTKIFDNEDVQIYEYKPKELLTNV